MSNIHQPVTIALLATGLTLIPAFILWVGRQERLGKPAIVPNSLWRNRVFTTICIGVFLTWGMFNAVEKFCSFFFQYVQEVSPIQTSLRFLPEPAGGAITNLVMGLIVHKLRADWAVLIATTFSTVSTLLMAVIDVKANY
jgi:Na+/melibiose symporter-like transporter